jgi:hypothetical protein
MQKLHISALLYNETRGSRVHKKIMQIWLIWSLSTTVFLFLLLWQHTSNYEIDEPLDQTRTMGIKAIKTA